MHDDQEMEAAAATLALDAKNYHAWAHRQALVAAWNLWDEEWTFTEAVLADDVRNNSAWNQRFFILSGREAARVSPDAAGTQTDSNLPLPSPAVVMDNELRYVAAALQRAPDNTSAWAYLRGLLTLPEGNDVLLRDERVQDLCVSALQRLPSCTPALALLSEVYRARGAAAVQQNDAAAAALARQHAETVYAALANADPLRERYWSFVSSTSGKTSQQELCEAC